MKTINKCVVYLCDKTIQMAKGVKQYLVDMAEKSRMKSKAQKNEQLRSEFKVVERNGCLWLTHLDVAFMKVAPLSKAEDVAKELNKARENAIEFGRL